MNDDLALEMLRLYHGREGEGWDLHAFFELAGDTRDRAKVLELVDALVRDGYLDSRGSDFYTVTEKGMAAARRGLLKP